MLNHNNQHTLETSLCAARVVSEGGGGERESSGRKRLSHRLRRRFPLAPCHDFYEWCCRLVSCCPLALVAGVPEIESGPATRSRGILGKRELVHAIFLLGSAQTTSRTVRLRAPVCICVFRFGPALKASVSAVETAPVHGSQATIRPRDQKDSGINDLEDHLALVETLHVDREKTAAEVQSQEERTF